MKQNVKLLFVALLGLLACSCSKESNETPVPVPESAHDSKIFLPQGTDLSIDDITLIGDGIEMTINKDSTYSSAPACIIASNRNDEIVYMSYGSGNEERLLGPVETALALLLPTVPNVVTDFDAEHFRAFKIMVALLKPTYDLVQAVEKSIEKYNRLNIEAIRPQLTAAVRNLHHLCGLDKESIESMRQKTYSQIRQRKGSDERPTYPYFSASYAKKIYYDFITVEMTDAQLKEEGGLRYWSCKFDVYNDNRFCYTSFTKSLKQGDDFIRYDDSWADTFRYLVKPYNLSEFMDLGLVSDLAYDPEHFLTSLVDYDYSNILEDPLVARFWEPIAAIANGRTTTYDKTVKRDISFDFMAANENLVVVGPGTDDNLLLFNIIKIVIQPILKAVIKEYTKSDEYEKSSDLDQFVADFIKWIAEADLDFRADLLQHFKDTKYSNWEKMEYAWDKLSVRIEKYVTDKLYDKGSELIVKRLFGSSAKLALKEYKKVMDLLKLGYKAADIYEFFLDSGYAGWVVAIEQGYGDTGGSLPNVPGSDL